MNDKITPIVSEHSTIGLTIGWSYKHSLEKLMQWIYSSDEAAVTTIAQLSKDLRGTQCVYVPGELQQAFQIRPATTVNENLRRVDLGAILSIQQRGAQVYYFSSSSAKLTMFRDIFLLQHSEQSIINKVLGVAK